MCVFILVTGCLLVLFVCIILYPIAENNRYILDDVMPHRLITDIILYSSFTGLSIPLLLRLMMMSIVGTVRELSFQCSKKEGGFAVFEKKANVLFIGQL